MALGSVVADLVALVLLILIRFLYVIHWSGKPFPGKSRRSYSTLIVLGLGGHTAEMLNLLSMLQKDRFAPRFYIAASTDNMSLQKARRMEDSLIDAAGVKEEKTAKYLQIYRSREVGQSYVTSVWMTLVTTAHALYLVIQLRPEVILCSGPGTCIPPCTIAFLFKVLRIRWSSIFYMESIARVKRLSLSGLILYKLHVADQFFVQWPELQRKYPRANYVGYLMEVIKSRERHKPFYEFHPILVLKTSSRFIFFLTNTYIQLENTIYTNQIVHLLSLHTQI